MDSKWDWLGSVCADTLVAWDVWPYNSASFWYLWLRLVISIISPVGHLMSNMQWGEWDLLVDSSGTAMRFEDHPERALFIEHPCFSGLELPRYLQQWEEAFCLPLTLEVFDISWIIYNCAFIPFSTQVFILLFGTQVGLSANIVESCFSSSTINRCHWFCLILGVVVRGQAVFSITRLRTFRSPNQKLATTVWYCYLALFLWSRH